jgi:hypothetical protein
VWKFETKNWSFSGNPTWSHGDVVVVWSGLDSKEFEVCFGDPSDDVNYLWVNGLVALREILKKNFNLEINDNDLIKFFCSEV